MTTNASPRKVDLVIVGAGFAGLYQLHRALGMGLSVQVLEAGDGVGGTWFWNRYPGARCDVESLDYSYSFSDELQQEWNWTERYAPQPEILRYINHVADRFNLRPHIQFNSRVASATFDEAATHWTVLTEAGERFEAQYLVMATGCLSIPQPPKFKGLETFKGQWYHSANWPREGVDFAGKRVGLIGTGSSGVQMTPVIAEQADHLTVFQRTANFSVPAQNEPLTEAVLAHVKAHYAERRALGREAVTGQFLSANDKSALEVSDEERIKEFEFRWRGAGGGFRMLRAFNDLLRNPVANRYAADFVRGKIRATVKDPAKAELLCPKDDLPFGTKRLCVDTNYYETFNRDNVDLVDVKANPITEITPTGLRTTQGDHPLDVIVFATGFDAMTGALLAIDIRGTGGQSLREKWAAGPRTYLGVSIAGFPNLFVIAGPGSPSVLSNVVHSIETHVDWISNFLERSRAKGVKRIEAEQVHEDKWVDHVNEAANQTLYPVGNSWYVGANMPGKPRVFMPYVAGVPAYRRIIEGVAEKGYEGFALS
ncbi:NAD(P)/FAD-dependent oxidoreductase [Hydrogenophaga sp.]|uniref:flavin-containing monooxygenase n=1 Tax=Hydrogenophaga sp. TaxID=1904254 RepID=UPI00261C9690|nr:NAD(P)/FAD-dependent oxidoreductase [Hydrogenophaga sp.]MCW5653183.1 NAD(P)/FAD-dependent oxidoreductase [Hydrogenophaga sp.]